MDFFAHQADARRHSRRMVVLFVLAVLAIVAAVDALIFVVFGLASSNPDGSVQVPLQTLIAVSLGVIGVIALASMYRSASLRGGGGAVARGLHATPVPPDTNNPAWRRLRNVIEEVAIAAGVPVPEIYVLEQEPGINAFAAGYSPSDAAICVTQGCLETLNRDELQGVIAHEYSHVLNGDMHLNIRLMGVVFGIVVLSVIGRQLLNAAFWTGGSIGVGGGRGRRDNGNALWAIGLGLLVIGGIGVFFARLIKASVARSRETLADASAVQFTRQTTGISGALKKIGALEVGSQFTQVHGEEVSHMLFGEGHNWSALFATHPPLEQRIRALEPGFNVAEFELIAKRWQSLVRSPHGDDPRASATGLMPREILMATVTGVAVVSGAAPAVAVAPILSSASLPSVDTRTPIAAAAVAAQVGQADHADFAAAAQVRNAVPDELIAAARAPQQALPLVLALALAMEGAARAQQAQLIAQAFAAPVAEAVGVLAPAVARLHPLTRLPLAAMAFPALRRQPRAEIEKLIATLAQMAHADGEVALDEYCLATLVRVQALDALDPARGFVAGSRKLIDCKDQALLVLALLAEFGHDDAAGAARAFQLGVQEMLPDLGASYAPPGDWQAQLDAALAQLDQLAPAGKELLVRGLTRAVREDGQVRVAEAELLRVVCAALHCPLPLVLGEPQVA
ncbi:MAG: M48 family metallopeptidase [Metallibacterium sp.]